MNKTQQAMIDSEVYIAQSDGRAEAVVRAWHDDVHRGAFRTCDEQPCHAINRSQAPRGSIFG